MTAHIIQISLTDRTCAAHTWAAACSTAGAAAPTHIADALVGGADLLSAALAGTAAAEAAHAVDRRAGWGGPSPRGLELGIRAGAVTDLRWETEQSLVTIAVQGERWLVTIRVPSVTHPRVHAGLAAAWSWRDEDDHAAVVAAMQEAGYGPAQRAALSAQAEARIAADVTPVADLAPVVRVDGASASLR